MVNLLSCCLRKSPRWLPAKACIVQWIIVWQVCKILVNVQNCMKRFGQSLDKFGSVKDELRWGWLGWLKIVLTNKYIRDALAPRLTRYFQPKKIIIIFSTISNRIQPLTTTGPPASTWIHPGPPAPTRVRFHPLSSTFGTLLNASGGLRPSVYIGLNAQRRIGWVG